jgi:putative phage-type endonuclease
VTDLPRYGAAVEILPASATRTPEWHQARARGITATDVAALLGASSWDTPFSLYWRKKSGLAKTENAGMRSGRRLEDTVRDMWLEDRRDDNAVRWQTCVMPGLLARADVRWQMATPDALIIDEYTDDPGETTQPWTPLEIKKTATWKGYGPDWSDQLPAVYRFQSLWQSHVIGADRGYVAVFGPDHTIRTYVVEAEPAVTAELSVKAGEFFALLQGDTPPPMTGAQPELDVLKQMYPDPAPEKEVTLGPDAASLVYAIADERAQARWHTANAKAVEATLRLFLGDAQIGTDPVSGRPLVKRTVTQMAEAVRKAHQRDTIRILTTDGTDDEEG